MPHPSLIVLLSCLLLRGTAHAQRSVVVDGVVGPAYLTQSRSHAIGHAFKPVARLGLRGAWSERLELGGTIAGILDANEHYRVVGVLAHGRLALWRSSAFSLGAALALGVGRDGDILHANLHAGDTIRPYGFVAVDARWSLWGRWLLGGEAAFENLAIVRVGLVLGAFWDLPAKIPAKRS